MKPAFVTVLAIALLPGYAIASFADDFAPEWTQPSSPVSDQLPPPQDSVTPYHFVTKIKINLLNFA